MEAGTRIPQRNATIVIKPAANRLESDPDRMKHLPIGAVESCPLGITGGTARKPLYGDNSPAHIGRTGFTVDFISSGGKPCQAIDCQPGSSTLLTNVSSRRVHRAQ